jgi:alkylation response protein AidB-like acyl-CoA dehydrogenase
MQGIQIMSSPTHESSPVSSPTDSSLLERVRSILPRIAANAARAEQERMVPAENIDLLKESGCIHAFQPRKYGGLEASLNEVCQCVALIASACGSTAWSTSLLATHNHQLALFSARAQEEVWGDEPRNTIASSVAPIAKAEEVDGGVVLNGDLPWSSGCDHAEWSVLGFHRSGAAIDPTPHAHFAIVPQSDYEIVDDWYSAGLKGSGTKTLKVRGVFVPEHRIESAKALTFGKSSGWGLYPDSKIFFSAYRPYFACGFSAVSLGIAERMIAWYVERSQNRVRAYTQEEVGKDLPVYMRLAESQHQVSAARALLEKDWAELTEQSARQVLPDADQHARWRTNQAYAVKMCVEAVDRLFAASGGSVWYESHEAQRLFRDVHITAAHAYTDYDVCKQIYGRHLIGLEPDPRMT